MRTLKLVHSVLTTAGVAIAASALTATNADAFTLTFDSFFGTSNSEGTGAIAQVDFTFVDLGADTVLLQLGIDNTTDEYSSFVDMKNPTNGLMKSPNHQL